MSMRKQREFTARHAVRQLGLGPEAFPLWVSLYYQIKDSPPPGTRRSPIRWLRRGSR